MNDTITNLFMAFKNLLPFYSNPYRKLLGVNEKGKC